MKILVIFAHPAFHKSHVNKVLINDIEKNDQITFHDLYEEYPDFDIDVQREQELLIQHDCIVFHFPLFWSSTPSLLKEWQDLVLEHGWAFGSKGNNLMDKLFLITVTAGAKKNSYAGDSQQDYTLKDLLAPLYQTAKLCKMLATPPFVVYSTLNMQKPEILEHKRVYSELLRQISSNEFNRDQAIQHESLNEFITHKEI